MARKEIESGERIVVVVPRDVKQRLKERAEAKGLPLATWLRSHLIEHDQAFTTPRADETSGR